MSETSASPRVPAPGEGPDADASDASGDTGADAEPGPDSEPEDAVLDSSTVTTVLGVRDTSRAAARGDAATGEDADGGAEEAAGTDAVSEPEDAVPDSSTVTTVLGVRDTSRAAARADEETDSDSGADSGAAADAETADPPTGEPAVSGEGDVRLRAAVAAWVSGDETEYETETDSEGPEPEAAPQSADEPAVDHPTAMFGVLRPEQAAEAQEADAGSPQERAEQMTTAFFGAARRDDESDESDDSDQAGDAGPGGKAAAGGRASGAGDGSSRTAKGAAAGKDGKDTESGKGDSKGTKSNKGAGKGGGTADDAGPADQEPEPEDAPPAKPPEQIDHPTTAFRVPKNGPAAKTSEKKPAKPTPAEPDAERTSQFVPLKPDVTERPSGPPRPAVPPKPSGAPRPSASPETGHAPTRPPAALPPEAPSGPPPASAPAGAGAAGPAAADSSQVGQQPLPDPPPLDLLAQLTNKPPPPETPIRTAVRRVKIWTPLLVVIAIVFVIVQAVRPVPDTSLSLTAPASYSFEGGKPSLPWPTEGQAYVEVSGLGVLGSEGEAKPVPIGSVAKTMTAYVVLQKHKLKAGQPGPPLTVDKKAEEDGKLGEGNGGESVLDTVKEGDKLTERDALSAMMIPSANNIARLLARWHSEGSEAEFVKEMNATAKELGMKNTTYTDPSGLQKSTQSTAADQVKLAKKAMEIPAMVEITKLPHWTDPSGKKWRNYNTLVPFDGAIGIKPGSTTAAGGNLLFAGEKKIGGTTQLIVGAVLGQHKPPIIDTANAVSKELLVAAGDAIEARKVVKKGDVVGYVDDQLGGRTPVLASKDVTAVGWPGLKVKLALEEGEEGAPHSAKAGEKVGTLTVGDGPGQVKVPVTVQEDLVEPGFGDKLTRIL